MDKSLKFDFKIYFNNGGSLKVEGFRLDIINYGISDKALIDYIVKDLRLLVARQTKEIIYEAH